MQVSEIKISQEGDVLDKLYALHADLEISPLLGLVGECIQEIQALRAPENIVDKTTFKRVSHIPNMKKFGDEFQAFTVGKLKDKTEYCNYCDLSSCNEECMKYIGTVEGIVFKRRFRR